MKNNGDINSGDINKWSAQLNIPDYLCIPLKCTPVVKNSCRQECNLRGRYEIIL